MTEQQLADARQRLADMEDLLRDLPEIFERKFQQRLQPLLERHDRLLEDNQQLRQQMRQLTATNAEMRQLPPAAASPTEQHQDTQATVAMREETPPDQTPGTAAGLQLPSLPEKPTRRWSFTGKGNAA